jgi:hypothetical protein
MTRMIAEVPISGDHLVTWISDGEKILAFLLVQTGSVLRCPLRMALDNHQPAADFLEEPRIDVVIGVIKKGRSPPSWLIAREAGEIREHVG